MPLSVPNSPTNRFAMKVTLSFLALFTLLHQVAAGGVYIACADGGNLV